MVGKVFGGSGVSNEIIKSFLRWSGVDLMTPIHTLTSVSQLNTFRRTSTAQTDIFLFIYLFSPFFSSQVFGYMLSLLAAVPSEPGSCCVVVLLRGQLVLFSKVINLRFYTYVCFSFFLYPSFFCRNLSFRFPRR